MVILTTCASNSQILVKMKKDASNRSLVRMTNGASDKHMEPPAVKLTMRCQQRWILMKYFLLHNLQCSHCSTTWMSSTFIYNFFVPPTIVTKHGTKTRVWESKSPYHGSVPCNFPLKIYLWKSVAIIFSDRSSFFSKSCMLPSLAHFAATKLYKIWNLLSSVHMSKY